MFKWYYVLGDLKSLIFWQNVRTKWLRKEDDSKRKWKKMVEIMIVLFCHPWKIGESAAKLSNNYPESREHMPKRLLCLRFKKDHLIPWKLLTLAVVLFETESQLSDTYVFCVVNINIPVYFTNNDAQNFRLPRKQRQAAEPKPSLLHPKQGLHLHPGLEPPRELPQV